MNRVEKTASHRQSSLGLPSSGGEFSMWPFEGKSEFILSCVYGNVLSELFVSFQQMLKLVVVHAGFGIVPWCNACLQVSPFTACTRQCEYCAVFL